MESIRQGIKVGIKGRLGSDRPRGQGVGFRGHSESLAEAVSRGARSTGIPALRNKWPPRPRVPFTSSKSLASKFTTPRYFPPSFTAISTEHTSATTHWHLENPHSKLSVEHLAKLILYYIKCALIAREIRSESVSLMQPHFYYNNL